MPSPLVIGVFVLRRELHVFPFSLRRSTGIRFFSTSRTDLGVGAYARLAAPVHSPSHESHETREWVLDGVGVSGV